MIWVRLRLVSCFVVGVIVAAKLSWGWGLAASLSLLCLLPTIFVDEGCEP